MSSVNNKKYLFPGIEFPNAVFIVLVFLFIIASALTEYLPYIFAVILFLTCWVLMVLFLHPKNMLSLFFTYSFVVYYFVSYFNSNLPLIVLDILLLTALAKTLLYRNIHKIRILGGSNLLLGLLGIYGSFIIIGLLSENIQSVETAIQGSRTLLFGFGFLFLSSIWYTTVKSLDAFLKIILVGSIFAALYGGKQFLFGLSNFELNRLATAGSSLLEYEVLGRARIPSTFGQPTPFAFLMMIAVLLVPITRKRHILPGILNRFFVIWISLFFFGLFISLMRGPLIALLVALGYVYVISPGRLYQKILFFVFMIIAFIFLRYLVVYYQFINSTSGFIRSIGMIVENIWSIIPFADSRNLSGEQIVRATNSISGRLVSFRENLLILSEYPLGVGVGSVTTKQSRFIQFSYVEIGYMRIAMELGWLGLISFISIMLTILFATFRNIRKLMNPSIKYLGRLFVGIWIAVLVTLISGGYLETEILAAIVWSIAGIMLNLDLIDKNIAEGDHVKA